MSQPRRSGQTGADITAGREQGHPVPPRGIDTQPRHSITLWQGVRTIQKTRPAWQRHAASDASASMDERHPEILPVMAMEVKLKSPGDTNIRTAEIDMMVEEEEARRSLPKWLSDKTDDASHVTRSSTFDIYTVNLMSITVVLYAALTRYLAIFEIHHWANLHYISPEDGRQEEEAPAFADASFPFGRARRVPRRARVFSLS
jgi:hypothetical protein